MEKGEKVNILSSLSPLFYLLFLVVGFRILSDRDPLHGSHQLSLLVAGLLALLQRKNKKHSWSAITLALKRNFISVFPAMFILLLVGMLIGAWANAGILGSMIYLGTRLLLPSLFLPGIAILSGLSAIVSGSSWTTAGTLGVALMGVGSLLGFPLEICAGAIVSGCYFGDKLSPLSDTTNLASSLTNVSLSKHIRYMMRTTIPSFIACLVLYFLWNLFFLSTVQTMNTVSNSMFDNLSMHFDSLNLIPLFLVFGLSMFGIGAFASLGLGILTAVGFSFFRGIGWMEIGSSLIMGYHAKSGDPKLDALLSGGGIIAILPTEFLILSAVWFGGILEGQGYLQEILTYLKKWIHQKWDVLLATMGSSFMLNLTTADQYLSLVIPARAFRNLAMEYHLESRDVSRALEDAGTISSPLIPWNSCGAFMATSLKMTTLAYLPYAWFNLLHILFSILLLIKNRYQKKEN